MKHKGIDYQFNRMLKAVFYSPSGGTYTLEYNPQGEAVTENGTVKKSEQCAHLAVKVTDLPYQNSEHPGFTCTLTVYNPGRDLLSLIGRNATWFLFKSKEEQFDLASENRKNEIINSTLQEYYNSRLRLSIFAGYWDENKKDTGYRCIFHGYVQGSSIARKGTDNVLKIGAYDIDVSRMDTNAVTTHFEALQKPSFAPEWIKEHKENLRGEKTWDATFKKYIRLFETTKIENERFVEVAEEDRDNNDWFSVLYVTSKSDYERMKRGFVSVKDILNTDLHRQLVFNTVIPGAGDMTSYLGSAESLTGLLQDLCKYKGLNIAYSRMTDNEAKLMYIVYPVGVGSKTSAPEAADIKIYNYQNLLSAPSVDGTGALTVKMLFNPACTCGLNLALILTSELNSQHGVATIDTSARDIHGNVIGSVESTSGMFEKVATTQLSTATGVAAQQLEAEDAQVNGYLFNTGFPIVRVTHNLDTYSNTWSTEVKTTPTWQGFKVGGNDDDAS